MAVAVAECQFNEVVDLANWLKDSGGSLGYPALGPMADALASGAENEQEDTMQTALLSIQRYVARIVAGRDFEMTEQVNPKHALPAPFETSRELELDNDRTLRDVKIMMVDDEPLNMDVLCVHLRDEGYENFVCVSEAADAISVLESESPDVLLLDLVMPEVSGFEILTEVRKNPAFKSLPVIVLTSSDDSNTKLNALQLGASDYLAKPIDPSELALRMRNTLTARAYEQRLKYQDPLTQLPNRLLFAQRAAAAMTRARTSGYCAAIVLININRFKLINDSLGPSRGDDILWLFSQRMCQAFELDLSRGFSETAEPSRFIARIAGDRFVIMVPGVEFLSEQNEPNRSELEYDENRDKLRASIDRFFEMMEKPITVNGQDIYLNVFIGVSALSVRSFSVEHLINDAETAMLHARRRLNTKVAFYSDQMDAKAHEMLSIENGLRTAVDNKEIFVVFQPKVNMSTGRIIGAEALVRWMHPEFGLISPVDFIPLAEDTGMIVSIGEWVLREWQ